MRMSLYSRQEPSVKLKSSLTCFIRSSGMAGGSGWKINLPVMRRWVIIDLPKIADPRGNLTFIEGGRHIPFEIRRVFYLYDVPGGEERGGHANRKCKQFIVAMSGSFDVVIDDGRNRDTVRLNRSYYGLLLPNMIWRELTNFSSGSVCMVVASDYYDAEDYIRDYEEFVSESGVGL